MMRVERGYSPCLRLASMVALVLAMAVSAQADDTWHNVYHSLKRFFTGKPSATPVVVHHHTKRYAEHNKTEHSTTEPTPAVAEGSPAPAASATPRVVVLPASSPTPTTTEGNENSVRAPDSAAKADHSPELGPVLRSLGEPTPASNPAALPSPVAGTGTTTSD
jgi:hypothetical protein